MRRRNPPSDLPFPPLARLGLATPPPFVGRATEVESIIAALTGTPLIVVNGAVGAGKTRLAGEIAEKLAEQYTVTRVACAPGDLAVAVMARCERAMDRRPGCLQNALETEAHLLIIDDVHHLAPVDVSRMVEQLVARPGSGRLLLLTRDILPLSRNDARRFTMTLEGLDEGSSRDVWAHLEDLYGPTVSGACDKALTRTRGMPLAMRREYSRSRYGEDAWELEALTPSVRAALEAVCVVRVPAAPAAVGALLEIRDVEAALIELVSRQLIDPQETGRFSVHDVVRDQVLDAMEAGQRRSLELRAVELVRGTGIGVSPKRPAWTAGDDGAIALVDSVDRSREIVMHQIAAGELDAASTTLSESAKQALARGAGGELLAQIETLRGLGLNTPQLRGVAALVAVRHGQVAEAIELGEAIHPVLLAFLHFRAGNAEFARQGLSSLCEVESLNTRAFAAAALAELEITCGRCSDAETAIARAFEHRAQLSSASLASLHLAFAEVESHKNNLLGARAALARAASAADDAETAARVMVRQVRNLLKEERFAEALKLKEKAEAIVSELDSIPLRDELARCEAMTESKMGSADAAASLLGGIVDKARRRGDEVSALRTELELAFVLANAGRLRAAVEIVTAASVAASRTQMVALVAQAKLINASISLKEMRITLSKELLGEVDISMLSYSYKQLAEELAREIAAWEGKRVEEQTTNLLEQAHLALIIGNAALALRLARRAAVEGERLQIPVMVGKAMAIVARLEMARGNKDAGQAAATRAVRESLKSSCVQSQIQALLVLSSLARDNAELRKAATYARDARSLAYDAGLPTQKLATEQALQLISSGEENTFTSLADASTATASKWAVAAAETLLSDLGFSTIRPYRCVTAVGVESYVASASPELLGMRERSLVVDAVRQVIIRNGEVVADLRRRSLLKRLLFLFSGGPGRVFSKEEIVEKVWEVEYHPLRHDAALFTNIMRIRRLLGEDGTELIQVCEEGYSLAAPGDFLYVEETGVVC